MDLNELKIADLQPSQFYISESKIEDIKKWFNPADLTNFEPIPIKLLDGNYVITDGHTRLVVALQSGLEKVPLALEVDSLNWDMYRECVKECKALNIYSPKDLMDRIISKEEYEIKWNKWCDEMQNRVLKIDLLNLPKELKEVIGDSEFKDVSCRSNAKTFKLSNSMFLKIDEKNELKREALMNSFLNKLKLGPKVILYLSQNKDYLLIEQVDGEDLINLINEPELLCHILATSLKKLHSLPIKDVPISSRYNRYIESLNRDINGGSYDTSFLLNGMKMSREEAWNIMQQNKELLTCDTFIHGDPCLPNIIANHGHFNGFIDNGMAGIGDRHIDIFWALWSLEYNLKTDKYNELFKSIYGKELIDEDKLKVILAFEVFG